MTKKGRILTGDRPTGKMHLGHYVGSLANRVRLQSTYDCFFIVADLHTLTTKPEREHIANLAQNIHDCVLDYLSVGIDPDQATIFLQSGVPETYELNLIFENLVSVARMERIPSLKDMARAANMEDSMPFGLLGYPILQAADILLPRGNLVPVGKDNESHVEITREIARRFNNLYGDVFPIPDVLVGDVPSLIGIDGQAKMSKSLNNAIFLSDTAEEVTQKVRGMFTDPNRVRADIPGRVEGNPVFIYHDAFNPNVDEINDLKERYLLGKVGDVEVKKKLTIAINNFLEPIRERRAQYQSQPGLVEDVLVAGTERARAEAQKTMAAVREAMGMYRLPVKTL
ncbi:MAG: tryptophan--tRNA ligase [Chloroflexi bacterium]|uniref:tryptophan--tRNA ligase n=1 Tax=Candidatus Flexifilum breve TaxID=3140694 RepID=UPI003134BDC1|nr:tryptophan--tRNA ligase [Chloroflexota bacterium]MBK9751075.1 tryptophan--tRNA ligase [Chloroflexota bacterium]